MRSYETFAIKSIEKINSSTRFGVEESGCLSYSPNWIGGDEWFDHFVIGVLRLKLAFLVVLITPKEWNWILGLKVASVLQ
ncbi:hypothetical protein [Gaoshiqia sediminis]|uniref:Uncharacterized protein n=1 Tax=Gaoshiqia sediminis TaxID=2986998 RepID=A0AA42C7J7_9BACT|nr:hypothetical protein [Gaoshiqia sediminis]MCW0485058.1 hypothetical protein [Gaoshiqia sediminis]